MKDSIELLKELISQRPVSADVKAVNRATGILHYYLQSHGIWCCVETVDDREILFAANAKTKTPDILLNVHLDVVPGETRQFEPYEEDGWLHGRGSNDCLGCAVAATQALLRYRGQPTVGILFSSDEEIGGLTTAQMVDRGYGATKLILVIDGDPYAIAVAQKGILTLTLTATGSAAHASMPWKGDNAIDRLIDGYLKIRNLFPEVKAGDEWHNTMVASVVSGGTVANRVPDEASLTVNIRYTEAGEDDDIVKAIAEKTQLQIRREMSCPPVVFEEETPEFSVLAGTMKKTLKRDIAMVRMNGATDARHFVALGVPTAIIGLPGRDIHGTDEAVEIAGLRAYEQMLGVFLRGMDQ